MAKLLSPIGNSQQYDNSGKMLAGGSITVYNAGSLTLASIYANSTGGAQSNPIVLTSVGRIPNGQLYLDSGALYDIDIKSSTGVVLESYTNISGMVSSIYVNATYYPSFVQKYTAYDTQTLFVLSDQYVQGANTLYIYVNGIRQAVTTDYTETSSTSFTFNTGLNAGDVVLAEVYGVTSGVVTQAEKVSVVDSGAYYSNDDVEGVLQEIGAKSKGYVSIKDYGAVGNGSAIENTAFTDAMAAIVATGKPGVIHIPAGTYKLTAGITVNTRYVSFVGENATLDFSTMTSGNAVTFTSQSAATPYDQALTVFSGVKVVGPGYASSVYGLAFNAASESGPSHMTLRNVVTTGFLVGHSYWNNAYCINNYGCDIYSCGTGIAQPSGFTNYGERIGYTNCTIFNNTTGIDMQNANGAINLISSSLDYNGRQIYCAGGRANLISCHVEASNYAENAFKVQGSTGATITMYGGWLLCTGTNTVAPLHAGTTQYHGGGIILRDVNVNNISTNSYWATGTGNVTIEGTILHDTPINVPLLVRADAAITADGGFEDPNVDDYFLYADTAAVTSRSTGTNISLSRTTANVRSGTYALRMTKVGTAGTAAQFAIVGKAMPNRYGAFTGYYSKTGAQTGTLYVTYQWVAMRDDKATPKIMRLGIVGTITRPLTSSSVGYTAIAGGLDIGKAPPWATHLAVIVNATSVGAGTIDFDDFEIHQI